MGRWCQLHFFNFSTSCYIKGKYTSIIKKHYLYANQNVPKVIYSNIFFSNSALYFFCCQKLQMKKMYQTASTINKRFIEVYVK